MQSPILSFKFRSSIESLTCFERGRFSNGDESWFQYWVLDNSRHPLRNHNEFVHCRELWVETSAENFESSMSDEGADFGFPNLETAYLVAPHGSASSLYTIARWTHIGSNAKIAVIVKYEDKRTDADVIQRWIATLRYRMEHPHFWLSHEQSP